MSFQGICLRYQELNAMRKEDVIEWVKTHKRMFKHLIDKSVSEKREHGFNIFLNGGAFRLGQIRRGTFKGIKLINSRNPRTSKIVGCFHVHRKQKGGLDYLSPYDINYLIENSCRFALIGFCYEGESYVKVFYLKRKPKSLTPWDLFSHVTLMRVD